MLPMKEDSVQARTLTSQQIVWHTVHFPAHPPGNHQKKSPVSLFSAPAGAGSRATDDDGGPPDVS